MRVSPNAFFYRNIPKVMAISENKFARRAENGFKKNVSGEEKITIDQQLNRLEEDIRKIKVEYDVFFSGGSKRAPYETKNRIETIIKRLADERSLTFAQRYQYNSVVARFTSFRELWRRTQQKREEGRDALSSARAALAKQEETKEPEKPASTTVFVCSDVQNEPATVAQIYQTLLKAKEECGESAGEINFAHFERQLLAQTERFKEKTGCKRVAFEIGTENGRVVFKAKRDG